MDEKRDRPLSRTFGIPAARQGSIKNNESEILLLKRKIRELEERVGDLEGS